MLMGGGGMEPEADSGHRIQTAVESTAAKVVTRVVVPILLAIIGVFVMRLVAEQDAQGAEQDAQGDDIVSIKQAQAVTNTLLSERVIRQVDTNTGKINAHDAEIADLKSRVSGLERAQ